LAVSQSITNLGVANLTHATTERIPYQESFIYDSLALEVLIPSVCDSLVCALDGIGPWRQLLSPGACGADNSIRLVSEVRRKPTVSG